MIEMTKMLWPLGLLAVFCAAAADNGVIDGEELSGWIIGRTFTGPLDTAEKALLEWETKATNEARTNSPRLRVAESHTPILMRSGGGLL